MNKKMKLLAAIGVTIGLSAALVSNANSVSSNKAWFQIVNVDFFNNYYREDFQLSNGRKGTGNNLLYTTLQVTKGELITNKPADPTRKNYEFQGWYKEDTCENVWNFEADKVNKNTRLFAKWGVGVVEEEPEPPFTPPSTVLEESASDDYQIKSIMNFKLSSNTVKVSRSAILKLTDQKENVLPLMEYKVKASKTITATYNANKITVTCDNTVQTINVTYDSAKYTLENSTYETKATKYEDKAVEEESYHVMLAGSSSIEFWETSMKDLMPIVSYNHGIGGTTIEEWSEKLNQRLVYPYKPKMVVYYVGINNVINSKQDADTIWGHLEKFFNDTHEALPDTKVQYILMNLIPNYTGYFNVINAVNAKVVEYQKTNQWLTLINPGTALLKETGQPNAAYFRTDGLHLSYYGYVIWGGIIKQSIIKGLENG